VPHCKSKTGRVAQPITDAADTIGRDATGRDRSWICNAPLVTCVHEKVRDDHVARVGRTGAGPSKNNWTVHV